MVWDTQDLTIGEVDAEEVREEEEEEEAEEKKELLSKRQTLTRTDHKKQEEKREWMNSLLMLDLLAVVCNSLSHSS